VKQTAALLRDARAVLRRLDALGVSARATADLSTGDIASLREACDRLVS